MRRIVFTLFLSLVLLTACKGTATPAPTFTPEPPTQTPTLEVTMTPEPPVEIKITAEGMKDPYGIAINSFGQIYVSDMGRDRVLVFDADGDLLAKWDKHGSAEGEFNTMGFGGLAIDANDNVFVVDNANFRVQKFDKDGNYILQWGSEGTEDGQFVRAIGIAVDVDGNVYVTAARRSADRAHASTTSMAQFCDDAQKCFGFLKAGEVSNLKKVMDHPSKPFTAIIGGAKVSDKIMIIERLMDKADHIIIGGGMAFTFIKAMGGEIGKSLCELDKLDVALSLIKKAKEKGVQLHLQ